MPWSLISLTRSRPSPRLALASSWTITKTLAPPVYSSIAVSSAVAYLTTERIRTISRPSHGAAHGQLSTRFRRRTIVSRSSGDRVRAQFFGLRSWSRFRRTLFCDLFSRSKFSMLNTFGVRGSEREKNEVMKKKNLGFD